MGKRIRTAAMAVLVGVTGLVASALPSAPTARPGAGADWSGVNADSNETGFSQLSAINTGNVARLGLAWSMELPGEASLEAAPIAVGGMLYFTGSRADVYAVDGMTGELKWKFEPKTWEHNPAKMMYFFPVNRGVAYHDGKIFSAAFDGRLFALDAATGKVIWETETTDPKLGQTITGVPRVFRGKVIIGQGGADFGMRGYVAAWDEQTGKLAWKFYVVPASPEENKGNAAMEKAAKTWNGDFWKTQGGGGGPWDSMTFDAELNRVYVGTANAYDYDPERRSPGGGDNLYTASIVALDADTGKYIWHYQVNPRDSWDFDSTQQMTLATMTIGGKPRKVLMQAPKNGFFYVIDRQTGKFISAGQIAKQNWAVRIDPKTGRPVERKGIRYENAPITLYPSIFGAHSWMRMAYSPQTRLVYVPTHQIGMRYFRGEPADNELASGNVVLGAIKPEPGDNTGTLVAWDPVAQKARWKAPSGALFNGGTAATAGGLVFQGTGDGWFHAYEAASGKELWKSYVGMGIIAAPTVWAKDGKQFVSILAGYGGITASEGTATGWKYGMPRRLLTFTLDGKAVLDGLPQPDFTVAAVDSPDEKLDPAKVAIGKTAYKACMVCHGKQLVGTGGSGPDLRESGVPLDPDAFYSVVHDGALLQRGMPGFGFMNRDTIEAIRQYVRSRARIEIDRQKKNGS